MPMQSLTVTVPLDANGEGVTEGIGPYAGHEWSLIGWASESSPATDGALLWYSPSMSELQFVTPIGQFTSEPFTSPMVVSIGRPLFIRALAVQQFVRVTVQYNAT